MIYKLFFAIAITVFSCTSIQAQDINASTVRLGPFYINMKATEVEKLSNRKLSAKELKEQDENYNKMIDVMVDNVIYQLHFYPGYNDQGISDGSYILSRVICEDKRLKTKSGIAVGQNKIDIIKQLSGMNINFDFSKYLQYDDDGKPTKNFVEQITIRDNDASSVLILNIKNEKIISFELYLQEGGC